MVKNLQRAFYFNGRKFYCKKEFPSNRIRTSDLEITAEPLQSPALPTELSTAGPAV